MAARRGRWSDVRMPRQVITDVSLLDGSRADVLLDGEQVAEVLRLHRKMSVRQALERAARELLALQASDWAFIVTRELAGEPVSAVRIAHRAALEAALSGGGDGSDRVRNLAPHLCRAAFLEP